MKSIEQTILEQGYLIRETRGTSMLPLLREGRDLVKLTKPMFLKPGDVVLFKRRETEYVLHRIVKILDNKIYIRGDNCIQTETVDAGNIIAKMECVYRKGKYYSSNSSMAKRAYLFSIIRYKFRNIIDRSNFI